MATEDLPVLNEVLRLDNDPALFQQVLEDRQRALLDYAVASDGHYSFWHKDGGPILIPDEVRLSDIDDEILDPFEGWDQPGLNQFGQPFLSNVSNIVDLTIRIKSKATENSFGMSSLGRIGN